jgi:hypothetical protein
MATAGNTRPTKGTRKEGKRSALMLKAPKQHRNQSTGCPQQMVTV